MTRLDKAHEKMAALTLESSSQEILSALETLREAWNPGHRVMSPGTIGWLVNEFLPNWFSVQPNFLTVQKLLEIIYQATDGDMGFQTAEDVSEFLISSLQELGVERND